MESKTNKQSLMKGAVILSAGVLLSRIIGMVYRIPIRNILTDEGNSYYGVAYSIYVVILTLTAMAIPGALSKLIAERRAVGAYKEADRVYKLAMVYSIGVAIIMAFILWFSADFLEKTYYPTYEVVLPIRALAPTVVIATSLGVLRGYFQGQGDMVPTASSQVIEQIVNVIFSVLLAYTFLNLTSGNLEWGATGSALGTGAGAIAGLIVLLIIYKKKRPQVKKEMLESVEYEYQSSPAILKEILNMMVPVIISASVFSIMTSIDQSMISTRLPDNIDILRETGRLNLVPVAGAVDLSTKDIVNNLGAYLSFQYMTFMNIPVSLILQLGLATVPAIAAAMSTGLYKEIRSKIRLIFKVGLLIAAPSAIAFMLFAKPILTLVIGDAKGAEVLAAGSVGIIAMALAQLSAGVLQGMSKQKVPTINAIIACVIKVIVNIIALSIPSLTIYGFVHSTTICYVIYAILNIAYLKKHLDIKFSWKKILIKPIACAIVMGIIGVLIYNILLVIGVPVKISILIVMPICGVAYFLVGLATRTITKKDLLSFPGGKKVVAIFDKM